MNQMTQIKSRFLDLLLDSGALKFGAFKTKSGRVSPFFFNTGCFDHGRLLSDVALCYAGLLAETIPGPWHLYGPAYKGITLASSVAVELAKLTGAEVPFTFNRKEAKDHGEGGVFVGRALRPDTPVIIVEDIITGGTSIRETMNLLRASNASVRAVVVGIDRQERGEGAQTASAEMAARFGIPVSAILTLDDILAHLWSDTGPIERRGKIWLDQSVKSEIDSYRARWG